MAQIKDIGTEVSQFAKDIENETKRITWPSRQEAVKSTLAVVVISALFAAFFSVIDYGFSFVIRFILS